MQRRIIGIVFLLLCGGYPSFAQEGLRYAQAADSLIALGKYIEAIHNLDKALQRLEHSSVLYAERAFAYSMLELYTESERDYRAALRLDTACAMCYTSLGRIALAQGEFGRAKILLDSAILYDSSESSSFYFRGYAHQAQENFLAALFDYDKAIERDSGIAEYFLHRGLTRYRQKHNILALDDVNKAVALAPEDAYIIFQRGALYFQAKEYEAALSDYNRAFDLGMRTAELHFARGSAQYNLNNAAAALVDYSTAIALDSAFGQAYIERARMSFERNDLEAFCQDCKRAYNHGVSEYAAQIAEYCDATSAKYYRHHGLAAFYKSEYHRALALFNKGIRIDSVNSLLYALAGNAALQVEPSATAIPYFDRALRLDSGAGPYYGMRADAKFASGDTLGALRDYSAAVERAATFESPDQNGQTLEDVFVRRATVYQALGHFKRATDDCTAAIALDPNYAVAYVQRAFASYALGRFAEAIGDALQVLHMEPQNGLAHYVAGLAYAAQGRGDYCGHLRSAQEAGVADAAQALQQYCVQD